MKRSSTRSNVALSLIALLGLGCARLPLPAVFGTEPVTLKAWGPGTVFPSVEAAAIDALTYAHLQAEAAHDTEVMRGGTIHATRGGYSYDAIHVTKRPRAGQIIYPLKPQDVARFHVYPRHRRHVNPTNEQPSKADRRTVDVIDPLHRPLYILHPSLVIRAYRGRGHDIAEVADLRRPARSRSVLLAGPD
jgi:hypothetical protein